MYGPGHYSADESTDSLGVIDSDDFRSLLNTIVSYKVQRWNEAGKGSKEGVRAMPVMDLSYDEGQDDKERQKWISALAKLVNEDDDVNAIDCVHWIGMEQSDWEGIL